MSRKTILVALVVFAGSWWLFSDDRPRFNVPPSFFVRASAVFEYQQKPYTISQVIECRPRLSTDDDGSVEAIYHSRVQGSFGGRLEDGSAIIFVTPNQCENHRTPTVFRNPNYRSSPLQSEYFPVIAWMKDAGSVENIEAYFSRTYLDRNESAIKFIRFQSEEVNLDFESMTIGDFHWFFSPTNEEDWDSEIMYQGIVANCVGDEQWQTEPHLREALKGIVEPQALDHALYDQIDQVNWMRWFGDGPSFHYSTMSGSQEVEPPSAVLDEEPLQQTSYGAIPFRKIGDSYVLEGQKDFVIFNPEAEKYSGDRVIASSTFVVDGTPLSLKTFEPVGITEPTIRLFYRPETKSLCQVWSVYFHGPDFK